MYRERLRKQADSAASEPQPARNLRGAAIPGLMLLIGLAIGYLSRPAIEARFSDEPVTKVVSGENLEDLRDDLQSRTRHYLGSEDAPVTLIEFGDFH